MALNRRHIALPLFLEANRLDSDRRAIEATAALVEILRSRSTTYEGGERGVVAAFDEGRLWKTELEHALLPTFDKYDVVVVEDDDGLIWR
jgi:hypothetical protein